MGRGTARTKAGGNGSIYLETYARGGKLAPGYAAAGRRKSRRVGFLAREFCQRWKKFCQRHLGRTSAGADSLDDGPVVPVFDVGVEPWLDRALAPFRAIPLCEIGWPQAGRSRDACSLISSSCYVFATELIEPELSSVPALVCLPYSARFSVEAREPTAATSPSIDADRVVIGQWKSRFLRSMTANHGLARFMPRRIMETFPVKHEIGLLVQRDIRVRAGVNKEMSRRFVVRQQAIGEELPMTIRYIGQRPGNIFTTRV